MGEERRKTKSPVTDTPFPAAVTALLDALDAAIAVVDDTGCPMTANRTWWALMAPDGEMPSTAERPVPFRGCLPPFLPVTTCESIIGGIRSVLHGEAPDFSLEIAAGRDKDRRLALSVRPLVHKTAAVVVSYRDVTETRRASSTFAESRGHLYQAQKMEALGTLVAGVAHEINNPLSLLMFNLPILRRVWQDVLPIIHQEAPRLQQRKFGGFTMDYLQGPFPQLIADMEMAASRVSKIVRDLKNFSRQSQLSDKEPLQVNEAVTNAVRLARATLEKAGVRLTLDLQEDLPLVNGNLPSIEQVILNVLINAVQAIEEEPGRIAIKTGHETGDAPVTVSVTDNGRGVSPGIADRIFDPFVTDKQTIGGSGLGLAVSYSLIQAHGGTISFAPVPQGGTTFTIALPSSRAPICKKVLVVDDDPMVRRLILQMLSRSGRYQVEEAASGVDGLLRIGTQTPDLLILDLKMPGMNGLDVCRAVRRNGQLAAMKVLITTGHPNHPDLDEIRSMGYTDCYVKPLRVDPFRGLVDRIMTPPPHGPRS